MKEKVMQLARSFSNTHSKIDADETKRLMENNPFQCSERMDLWEYLKLTVGILVVPIKFALIMVVLLIATVTASITIIGADISKPLSARRVYWQDMLGHMMGFTLCLLMGIRVKFEGELSPVEEAKMVVAGPHSTVADPFVMAYACGGLSAVGKAEVQKTPLGPFSKAMQSIYVKREDKDSRTTVAQTIAERVDIKGPWNRRLGLFPEGTCTNRTSLINFRTGAFAPGMPIQPIVLKWEFSRFDPAWTAGSRSRVLVLLKTLSQVYHTVTVKYLPVYIPSEEEKKDSILFANNVRLAMANSIHVPVSDHSYSDMFLAKTAAKCKLAPGAICPFTFNALKKEVEDLNISNVLQKDAEALIRKFAKAPEAKIYGKISKSGYELIAKGAAEAISLEKPLTWEQVRENEESTDLDFHTMLIKLLRARYGNK